jgi:hypothetical protein
VPTAGTQDQEVLEMDIVFLAVTLVLALVLPRSRALVAVTGVWAVCLAMVGWGPAHNDSVHVDSLGFWVPWLIVLAIGLALAAGIDYLRRRRAPRRI